MRDRFFFVYFSPQVNKIFFTVFFIKLYAMFVFFTGNFAKIVYIKLFYSRILKS